MFSSLSYQGSGGITNSLLTTINHTVPAATNVTENITGNAFFSLDVTNIEQNDLDAILQNSGAKKSGAELSFLDPRAAMASLTHTDSNIFAVARSVHDWNSRNKVGNTVI